VLAEGQIVDRYTVLAQLGEGGMATVYKVRHHVLGSFHALKLLKVQSPTIRERLMEEGRAQATLRHANIVTVTDVIDVDGAAGLVMEFVDGPSLEEWLRDNHPSLDLAEKLFRGVLAGVARAHREGLVHRDLKPGNVLLDQDDDGLLPKVTDFGLVKALSEAPRASRTRAGIAMGTPAYMAPEQIRDARTVDQRADVFALGCILYELVCGRAPFGGVDTLATFNAVTSGQYPAPETLAPGVPARVIEAIAGCLRVDRERRIADCAELRRVLGGEGAVEGPSASVGAVALGGGDLAAAVAPAPAVSAPPIGASSDQHAASHPSRADSSTTMLPPEEASRAPRGTLAGTWFERPANAHSSRVPRPRFGLGALVGGSIAALGALGVLLTVGIAAVFALKDGIGASPEPATPAAPPATAPVVPAPEPGPTTAAAPAVEPSADIPAPVAATTTAKSRQGATTKVSSAVDAKVEPAAAAGAVPAPARGPSPTPVVAPAKTSASTGTVRVTGDADRVELAGAHGRVAPGSVPTGTYKVYAKFPGTDEAPGETIVVRAGQTVTLDCNSGFLICRVKK